MSFVTSYLILADTHESEIEVEYFKEMSREPYVDALSHLCMLLRDPEVFNIQFFYRFWDELTGELISVMSIKTKHVDEEGQIVRRKLALNALYGGIPLFMFMGYDAPDFLKREYMLRRGTNHA